VPAVVVAGALANKPRNGGEAWVRLSWILGLRQLGLDVRFVEQLSPESCVDEQGAVVDAAESVNVAWFRSVTEQFGLSAVSTLLVGDDAVVGPPLLDLMAVAEGCSLVNISGHLDHARLFAAFRSRIHVDIDPGFTQFWHALGYPGAKVAGHDQHFTIGESIGSAGCSILTSGVHWRATRQPVLLADWPVTPVNVEDRFTTVASWRAPFGSIVYEGRTYGLKVHEFRRFLDLPSLAPHVFEVALSIHRGDAADLEALHLHGWQVVDPAEVAATPDDFRRYVQGSAAEFSVAQGVYVDTRSGWFSDRSARYLASGKPVLVQDTGVGQHLPVGRGLLTFSTSQEAADGAASIAAKYAEHSAAARELAEQYFAAERVLARFCDEAGLTR
jgi:hypothetical protein